MMSFSELNTPSQISLVSSSFKIEGEKLRKLHGLDNRNHLIDREEREEMQRNKKRRRQKNRKKGVKAKMMQRVRSLRKNKKRSNLYLASSHKQWIFYLKWEFLFNLELMLETLANLKRPSPARQFLEVIESLNQFIQLNSRETLLTLLSLIAILRFSLNISGKREFHSCQFQRHSIY